MNTVLAVLFIMEYNIKIKIPTLSQPNFPPYYRRWNVMVMRKDRSLRIWGKIMCGIIWKGFA